MPHRHWFVIHTVNGRERRSGPYASHKAAERKANEQYKTFTSNAGVRLIYDLAPRTRRPKLTVRLELLRQLADATHPKRTFCEVFWHGRVRER
jgi:hypothetical protein